MKDSLPRALLAELLGTALLLAVVIGSGVMAELAGAALALAVHRLLSAPGASQGASPG